MNSAAFRYVLCTSRFCCCFFLFCFSIYFLSHTISRIALQLQWQAKLTWWYDHKFFWSFFCYCYCWNFSLSFINRLRTTAWWRKPKKFRQFRSMEFVTKNWTEKKWLSFTRIVHTAGIFELCGNVFGCFWTHCSRTLCTHAFLRRWFFLLFLHFCILSICGFCSFTCWLLSIGFAIAHLWLYHI